MQQEINQFMGDERIPGFDNIPQLLIDRADAKETLRWRPVTAGGVPHELIKDDVYDGFYFLTGSNIHANQWPIHRDAWLYPELETFNPERWLSPKYLTRREPLEKYPSLQNFSAFGFRRRICPGMNIAENSLHLLIVRMAWATNISERPGVEVPLYDYTTGLNVQPKPFVFDPKARSERRRNMVDKTREIGKDRNSLGSA